MGQSGKFLVTNEGRFDLSTNMWDDQLFSDILVRDNPIDAEKAMGISRALRAEILRMEFQTITMPFIEKMIEAKLMEFGLTKPSPIRLDQSIFVESRLVLSDNARRVLRRRYLERQSRQSHRDAGENVQAGGQSYRQSGKKIRRR